MYPDVLRSEQASKRITKRGVAINHIHNWLSILELVLAFHVSLPPIVGINATFRYRTAGHSRSPGELKRSAVSSWSMGQGARRNREYRTDRTNARAAQRVGVDVCL